MHDRIDIKHIRNQIKGNFLCLILFGSYSRGDNKKNSDIDILQVSDSIQSYSTKDYNFSVYSEEKLYEMAKEGSLFVLHLIREGTFIAGNNSIFNNLKNKFVTQNNYSNYKKDILLASKLLDINSKQYQENWSGYNNLLGFLFRSYLYASLYDENKIIFSIDKVMEEYDDDRIITTLELRKKERSDYKKFIECRQVFEEYAKIRFINEYITPLELLRNLKKVSKFITSISFHFINNVATDPDY